MTIDGDNPFKKLDKKNFPKKRGREARIPPPHVEEAVEQSKAESMPEELFSRAMQGVLPLEANQGKRQQGRQVAAGPPEPEEARKERKKREESEVTAQLADLVSGKVEFSLDLTDEYIQGHVTGLDTKTIVRLKSGYYSPERHFDMHGMNTEQAFFGLVEFIRENYLQGRRCLLLIPGRGKNSPEGFGVLREKVQSWLTRDPLKRVVLAFCTALPKHGGAGALYVLLRKNKGKGKINWERLPVDLQDMFDV